MNVHVVRRPQVPLAFAALAALGSLAWSGPSLAGTACLKGASLNKLCLDLSSVPGDSVQPSQMTDSTKTYVNYAAKIYNLVAATSRNVQVDITFSPTPPTTPSVSAGSAFVCSTTASKVSCVTDKLDGVDPAEFDVLVEAPTYPTTVTQMVATGVVGWNGNTASTSQTVAVSTTAGESYVPANQRVSLVTSNDSNVTPEHPLWASITIDPQPTAHAASIQIVNNAIADANCIAGIYLSPTYGGPYLCRDLDHPTRAVRVDTGEPGEGIVLGKNNPGHMTMKWDASLIQSLQMAPNPPLAPTGLPPFAQFVSYDNIYSPPDPAYAAISKTCDGSQPPCLVSVQRLTGAADGDWQVDSLQTNDGSKPVWLVRSPLGALYAALDFVISPAQAQITVPLKINTM